MKIVYSGRQFNKTLLEYSTEFQIKQMWLARSTFDSSIVIWKEPPGTFAAFFIAIVLVLFGDYKRHIGLIGVITRSEKD